MRNADKLNALTFFGERLLRSKSKTGIEEGRILPDALQ